MGITFDGSITLGALLNAGVLLVGFVVAFTKLGGRIDLLSLRVAGLEQSINQATGLDKHFATIEERVTNHSSMLTQLQRELNDLRRGEGWVQNHRKSVDGEYGS